MVNMYLKKKKIRAKVYRNEKLYYYDVNSLYPFIMSTQPMPVGKPIAFEGDIRSIIPDAFGICIVK